MMTHSLKGYFSFFLQFPPNPVSKERRGSSVPERIELFAEAQLAPCGGAEPVPEGAEPAPGSPPCHPGPKRLTQSDSVLARGSAQLGLDPDAHAHTRAGAGAGMETDGSQSSLAGSDSPHDPW